MHVMRRLRTIVVLAAGLSAGLVACSSQPVGKTGNLANGGFTYKCVNATEDPACKGLESSADPGPLSFPTSVAVGADFRVEFTPLPNQVQNAGLPQLRAVASDYLLNDAENQFQAKKAGYCAIVARSSKDGTVIDYTLVHMADVANLAVWAAGSPIGATGTTITSGETLDVQAVPTDGSDNVLDGTLKYTWSLDSTNVVEFDVPATSSAHATLRAVTKGTAQLHVQTGNAQTAIQVTVQ